MGLLDAVKLAAVGVNEAQVQAAFMFGTVTADSPLVIRVENRFDISGDAIVVTREFRAGGYSTHTHTIDPHAHAVPGHLTETASGHNHPVSSLNTQQMGLVTNAENYSGLTVGDMVVLLRNQGGQSFLVLGRM